MPFHWLRRLLAPPEPFTVSRPGVNVTINQAEHNIRKMRDEFGEPVAPGRNADGASWAWNGAENFAFSPAVGFDRAQAERVADQIAAAIALLRARDEALAELPTWGTHYPGAVVLDEDGTVSLHTNGAHAVPAYRLRGLTPTQREWLAHEGSHTTFRVLGLPRDATHDDGGGAVAAADSSMARAVDEAMRRGR